MKTLIISVLVSFAAALISGRFIIPALRKHKAGQHIREDGPQEHKKKEGTPTKGGVIIMIGTLAAMLLYLRQETGYAWFALIGALAYGLIGLIDDMIIVLKHRSEGLTPKQKLILQFVFGVLISVYAYLDPAIGSAIYIPIANVYVDFGWFYIPFNVFFLMALTNSVNLTDGLDGLAGGVSLVNTVTFAVIFMGLVSTFTWSFDMMIFAAAVTGGIMGFLRYNAYPAKVFMGDTGAFFLGGALSMLAIISKLQIIIPVMGFMFVLSSVSCIIQVLHYKRTKKRVFKMAPIHHHFELCGIHETKIVVMYMMITAVLCLITLLILS